MKKMTLSEMRHRVRIRKEQLFDKVDELYVDGKRDAALLLERVVGNYSTTVKTEKRHVW